MKPQNRSVTALSQLLDARDGLHRALGIARTIGHVAGDSDLPIFNKEHSQMTNYCIPQCLSQEGKALVL
jgi:uncharacterized membrane protein (DUF2068 family)